MQLMDTLLSLSPLDGRYHNKLDELRPILSEYGLIHHRLIVEIRWLQHLAAENIPNFPKVDPQKLAALDNLIINFNETDAQKIKHIENVTNHDVKAIEYYLREYIEQDTELKCLVPFIHFAATSEDINNLSYALMIKKSRELLGQAMGAIIKKLDNMALTYADYAMLSRTHGQAATPTTIGKELKNFSKRLKEQQQIFLSTQLLAKFNGAVGNYNAHKIAYPEINWPDLCGKFIKNFDLNFNPYTTQIEPHDFIAELLHALIRFNTILIGFNRDMWGYISLGYFTQKSVANEVGSSTMPHKINPIDFENSEGNLGIANAIADHLANKLPISRWQRDLSDSTVLRNFGCIFGYAFLAFQATEKGLNKLSVNQQQLTADLTQHWEVLTEAIQTVMRRYGITDAYEQLKAFSRGQAMTADMVQQFIVELNIPEEAKGRLAQLAPQDYLGYAEELCAASP